jgi:predicted acyl esterase
MLAAPGGESAKVHGMRHRRTFLLALVSILCLALVAAADASAALIARGSAKQVQVTGATPGADVALVRHGRVVQRQAAGSLGGALFRDVRPGRGYRVRSGGVRTPRLRVYTDRPAPLSTSGYDQKLTQGYQYITMRDGTKLAADVRLPSGPGPYPTLVEYAGYGYANPGGAESGISLVGNLLGFAVVDVNMRGTGCSGGAFDYFERNQALDGYDVIETLARQSWVAGHRVGMMGVSYGGISQLFVGQTNPPHLAGISPLSVIDNTAATLYPGGILNTGFALSWAKDRVHDALPASPTGGQPWAYRRIQDGDATCKANQDLHPEAVDLLQKIADNKYYIPKVADPLSPDTFVHKIHAPVYMACQFTDEQTGGHCPDLASRFTGTNRKWFTFTNGVHTDSLDPLTFNRWYDFLRLYVARQAPGVPAARALAPTIYNVALGISNVNLPDDPIQAIADYGAAKRSFEALKPIRILFDNGAGDGPYRPFPGFEQSWSRFPLPATRARSLYFGPQGSLAAAPPANPGRDSFTWDKAARPATSFTGNTGTGGLWGDHPDYHWVQNPPGTALSYLTPPLAHNEAVIGPGAVYAWVKASVPKVDLQATITEVRPDGKETFVQNGWLRSDARKLDARRSTLLEPVPTFLRRDSRPLPSGRWARIAIPLYYEGHIYRAGSRIRVQITEPGGDQPVWSFADTDPQGTATVRVARSRRYPSRLVLPFVGAVAVPTPLPPCPGLRGEPCRTYVPLTNVG